MRKALSLLPLIALVICIAFTLATWGRTAAEANYSMPVKSYMSLPVLLRTGEVLDIGVRIKHPEDIGLDVIEPDDEGVVVSFGPPIVDDLDYTLLAEMSGLYHLRFSSWAADSEAEFQVVYKIEASEAETKQPWIVGLLDPFIRGLESTKCKIDLILQEANLSTNEEEDVGSLGSQSGLLTSILLVICFVQFWFFGNKIGRTAQAIAIALVMLLALFPCWCLLYGFISPKNWIIKAQVPTIAPLYVSVASILVFALFVFLLSIVSPEEGNECPLVRVQRHQTSLPLVSALLITFLSTVFALNLSIAVFQGVETNSTYGLLPIVIVYALPSIMIIYSYLNLPSHFLSKTRAYETTGQTSETVKSLCRQLGIRKSPVTYLSDRTAPVTFGNIFHQGIVIPENLRSFALAISHHDEAKANIVTKFLLLHELAHTKNKDVLFMSWAGYFLSLSKWWLPPLIITPILYDILFHSRVPSAYFVTGVVMLATLIFFLLYLSIARQREITADSVAISHLSREEDCALRGELGDGQQVLHRLLVNLPLLGITLHIIPRKANSHMPQLRTFMNRIRWKITTRITGSHRIWSALAMHPPLEDRAKETTSAAYTGVPEPHILSKENALWVAFTTSFLWFWATSAILILSALFPYSVSPALEGSNLDFIRTHYLTTLFGMIAVYVAYACCGSLKYTLPLPSWRGYIVFLEDFSKRYLFSFAVSLFAFAMIFPIGILGSGIETQVSVGTYTLEYTGMLVGIYVAAFILCLFLTLLKTSPILAEVSRMRSWLLRALKYQTGDHT